MVNFDLNLKKEHNYRPDIDGLRAMAIILVIVHHAFPNVLPGGFIGVDLFFVISGFLISTIILNNLESNKFSFIDFYVRRAKRIFPALSLVLIVSLMLGWFLLLPADYKQLGKHVIAGSAFVSNFAFWNEAGYFDSGSKLKPLLHLWSLGIEEQYYIVWPMMLWLMTRNHIKIKSAIIILLIISFVVNIVQVRTNISAAFFSPITRFWELLIGSLLAYNTLHHKSRLNSLISANTFSIVGSLLLLTGVVLLNPSRKFPGFWALLPTVGAYLLISAGQNAWINRKILSNKVFVWIGLISYPLYLWHWPTLVFTEIYAGQSLDAYAKYLAILGSVIMAWLTYKLVEQPIRFGSANKRVPYFLYVILVIIGASGSYTYARDGFDFRYPKIIRTLAISTTPIIDGWRENACILEVNHLPSEYKEYCVDKNRRPLVFIWGDSHAAALYPGFKKLQDEGNFKFGIGQRNGAICPPLLGDPRPWCKALNEDTFKTIERTRPEVVFLYAHWARGINSQGLFQGEYDLNLLEPTIIALKRLGISKIVINGPTPYWKDDLPKLVIAEWKKGSPIQLPPLYMKEGLVPDLELYESVMKTFAERMGVNYISALKVLCNANGCQTRNAEHGDKIASVDYGHLTVNASERYIKAIAPQFLQKP